MGDRDGGGGGFCLKRIGKVWKIVAKPAPTIGWSCAGGGRVYGEGSLKPRDEGPLIQIMAEIGAKAVGGTITLGRLHPSDP